ncbi:MAG TPA: glycosyltransferase 87 family protein [Candidatus Dormibacteraeota bacterium]
MRTRRLILGGLLVFTLVFAVFALEHMLPPQPYGLADDWRVFYAAASVVQHGGNPYDASTMHAAEQAAQHYQHVQPSLDDFTDLPVVALMLRAVTWLPFWSSYILFTVVGVVIAAAALIVWIRDAGWRRGGLWVLGAMCSWPMLLGFFSGQFDALLLGAAVAAVVLMRRNRPLAAGLCMAAVLLKPHLLWPLPLLLFAVWLPDPHRAWRFAGAAGAVLAGGAAAGFLLVPNSSGFIGHLLGFGSRVGSVQPDLAGLPGMVLHLPGGPAISAALAIVGVAAVLALAAACVGYRPLRRLGAEHRALVPLAGLALWLALTPYAHPNDDVLLFPLLALLMGRDARELGGSLLTGAALASMAILPTIWPFHVLTVPVTPVAVSLTAAAALARLRSLLRPVVAGSAGEGERGGRIGGVVVEAAPALAAEPAGRH